ncbi:MAG: TIGR01777 family protein [Saprospiraceae bacterium]|nr:TIGR01777 family protein [Saprospiraceae bacterium]
MKRTILIAGGSGLIGSFLRKRFIQDGHEVRILSRSVGNKQYGVYHWDPERMVFDLKSFLGVDVVINLAGASIAGSRWTDKRKKLLHDSRIKTSTFLLDQLQISGQKINCYIGASAVGIYGDRSDEILTEISDTGHEGFLVNLSREWEAVHQKFSSECQRVCIIRIGVVLANEGGALPELGKSVFMGIGFYLGDGSQYLPWIHIADLGSVFGQMLEDHSLSGIINAAAPEPVTNYQLTKAMVALSRGPGWLLPVPKIFLRLGLGQMADVLLQSQRVIPSVLIQKSHFFEYSTLADALKDLSTGSAT